MVLKNGLGYPSSRTRFQRAGINNSLLDLQSRIKIGRDMGRPKQLKNDFCPTLADLKSQTNKASSLKISKNNQPQIR